MLREFTKGIRVGSGLSKVAFQWAVRAPGGTATRKSVYVVVGPRYG